MTEDHLERRLRRALSARAAGVTSRDLRHEPAPSRITRQSTSARWWLPLTAGIAAAGVSITAFALLRPAEPAPTPPAAPGSTTAPAEPTAPTQPTVSPSATTPASPSDTSPPVSPLAPSRRSSTAEPTSAASESERKPTVAPTPR